MASVSPPASAEDPHWDYHSHGGAAGWGELTEAGSDEPAFPECNFTEQSPVDIPGDAPMASAVTLDYEPTPLQVVNNGHTIQVNYAPGSTMSVDGKSYVLLQLHFHAPSEHEIDGDQAPLEAHFVHQASDGEYAVVGVMIVAGNPNAAFQAVLDTMPHEEGTADGAGAIDAGELLPSSLDYYAYDGSFTTPPCSEGVKWHVLSEPVQVSLLQIGAFRALEFLSHEGEFTGNARPVQALNGRLEAGQPDAAPDIVPPSTGSAGLAAVRE